MKHFSDVSASQIAFVGDRLLTDVVLSNEAGFFSIYLTEPLSLRGDNIPSIFLRFLESRIHRCIKLKNHNMNILIYLKLDLIFKSTKRNSSCGGS